MISVIVPIYNVEDYLDKCIESIINQTFRDFEIILINDGSFDKSEEKCLKWAEKDERIIYVRKKNEGQGAARNLGVDIAKGDYITFVDADDWLEKDALEYMYDAAVKSDADIVTGNFNYVFNNGYGNYIDVVSALRIDDEKKIETSSDIDLINKARLFMCGKLYKRYLFIKYLIRQPEHAFEDTAVMPLLVIKADTIYHINKTVYNYYKNRKGSTVNNLESLYDMKKSLMKVKESFNKEKLFNKYYEALKKLSYSQVRFVYKKLLNEDNKIDRQYEDVLIELYNFMDSSYPDWVNIDKFKLGTAGNINLKKAVENIIFDSSKHEYSCDVLSIVNNEILIVEAVYEEFFNEYGMIKFNVQEKLTKIASEFNGVEIIFVSFEKDMMRYKRLESYFRDIFKNNKFRVNIMNFEADMDNLDEGLLWDLSDMILRNMKV